MSESEPVTAQDDDRVTVLALLRMHGLSPSPKEIDALVAAYPVSRHIMTMLSAMPGMRYEEPAVAFDPRVIAP
jgi:hypothetical protein